ncbi:MAG: alkane 1-monooxygenase [Xanthomonadaceae bacterium]|nr:alkane 1-monooxygenase [Xanthomonadaceae bacterium]
MRWRDLGFFLPFGLALLPAGAVALIAAGWPASWSAGFPLLVIFGVLPVIDLLCGIDTVNLDAGDTGIERHGYFRALTLLTLLIWPSVLIYCAYEFARLPLGPFGMVAWIVSTGVLGGILAINPAHELVHKSSRLERLCGGLLLTSVGYHGFKVEHVRGHHVNVATPEDSSSANFGESVYAFVPRALRDNVRNAWRLEAQRLRQGGRRVWSHENEMLRWTALWLVLLVAFALWLGPAGALFFVAQGLAAASTLEIINYVEHYGLERHAVAPGRYERVTHLHSWNAPQRVGNWLLFNLQRHSDHHANARRRYQLLQHHDDSPQLPAGYATMFVLALVPPLWRRVMDPRALRARGAAPHLEGT